MAPAWSQLRVKLGWVDRSRIAVKASWGQAGEKAGTHSAGEQQKLWS